MSADLRRLLADALLELDDHQPEPDRRLHCMLCHSRWPCSAAITASEIAAALKSTRCAAYSCPGIDACTAHSCTEAGHR